MSPRNQPMNSNFRKITILFLFLFGLAGCVQPPVVGKSPAFARPGEQLLAAGVRSFTIGDYTAAMRSFKDALVVGRGVDDVGGMALAEVNMAETALAMGEMPQARGHLLEAQRLVEREGLEGFAPRLEMISASLAIREGRGDEAISILAPYLTNTNGVHGDNGFSDEYRLAALISRTELALAAADQQKARSWVKRYRQTLAGMTFPDIRYQARLCRFEARLAHWDGNPQDRDRFLRQAVKVYRESLARPGLAAVLTEWGRYLMAEENRDVARDRFDRAFFVRVEMRDRYGSEQVLTLLEALDAVNGVERLEETHRWRAVVSENHPKMWGGLIEKRNPVR